MPGGEAKELAMAQVQVAEMGVTQPHRIGQQDVEHRLKLAGRSADDLQHLGGGGLPLQSLGKVLTRFGELAGARFESLFQFRG